MFYGGARTVGQVPYPNHSVLAASRERFPIRRKLDTVNESFGRSQILSHSGRQISQANDSRIIQLVGKCRAVRRYGDEQFSPPDSVTLLKPLANLS